MIPTGIGGYIAPGPVCDLTIPNAALPNRFEGDRKAYSMNYFLLKAGNALKLHRLNQDEQWFFHQGSGIQLHIFSDDEVYSTPTLGSDLDQGQVFQGSLPHNQWFGAELLGPGYALVGCSLAPGWDKRDTTTPTAEQMETLETALPEQAATLNLLK